jgi:ISXO2-like transposase domain
MGSEVQNPDQPELAGEVAIDGAYFGGKIKQANRKADRADRRTAEEKTGKLQVVVVARETLGRTLPFVVQRESAAVPLIRPNVASGTSSMPTKAVPGTPCTRPTRCCGSTTAASSRTTTALARTTQKAGSAACAGPRWVSTIGSAAGTSISTQMRWLGGKTIGASRTACTSAV